MEEAMDSEEHFKIVKRIILMLKNEFDEEESLRILGACSSFFLNLVRVDRRKDVLEEWVCNIYAAELELQRHFGDNGKHQLSN
jgi:hypothetical protein